MGMPVVTVAAGGLPVVDVSSSLRGTPVTEVASGMGVRVTKVAAYGLPVVYETIGVVAPVTYATLDPATVTAVTLSGGNLVATNTGTTSADQGAKVAAVSGKTSGKYYFEVEMTAYGNGVNGSAGVGTTASTYTGMGNGGTTGDALFLSGGNVWSNGGNTGTALGPSTPITKFGFTVDLDNRKFWARKGAAGNWNNSGAANPATNVGGITIPAGTMVPFLTFGGSLGTANCVFTANFGASAFVGAVPSGITAGWPA
jgi:hypothetical protein